VTRAFEKVGYLAEKLDMKTVENWVSYLASTKAEMLVN